MTTHNLWSTHTVDRLDGGFPRGAHTQCCQPSVVLAPQQVALEVPFIAGTHAAHL